MKRRFMIPMIIIDERVVVTASIGSAMCSGEGEK
jgi:hypothetical protein